MHPTIVKRLKVTALSVVFPLFFSSAHAQSLNFVIPGQSALTQGILNYYNGGASQEGQIGPNYGITFDASAVAALNYPYPLSNVGNEPDGGNAMGFLTGSGTVMNVAAGFNTGLSFYYAAPQATGAVSIYSGLNGTGTLLATVSLALTPDGNPPLAYDYGVWVPIGMSFSGTAQSVDFTGTDNELVFSDVTLGSVTPAPEPSTIALCALGASAFLFRRRKAV